MDGVEALVIAMGSTVASVMPEGVIADFVNDAIFGGLGAFLVFVPLVFILTLIIGALEDSGYLARAALICHRPLGVFACREKALCHFYLVLLARFLLFTRRALYHRYRGGC